MKHRQAVLRDRVDMLFAAIPLSQGILAAVAYILFSFHNGHTPGRAADWWFGLICSVLALRVFSAWLYRHRRRLLADDLSWLRLFRAGAALAGLCWGLAGILLFPPQNETLQMFTLLTLAGIAAGALGSMTADYLTFSSFVVLTLGPVGTMAVWQGEQPQASLGLMLFLMMLFLLGSSRAHWQSIVDLLTLRHENTGLIDDLEREKQRVIAEAQAMMGTVLASAPITLWAVDMDGVITFMDGKRLAGQQDALAPRLGKPLREVFADNPQLVYETQRALGGESFTVEIELARHSYEIQGSPLRAEDGRQQGAIAVAIDISERKRHERELTRRANYDELTGLPNRSLIMSQAEHAFEHAKRQQRTVTLFFLDLDNFKVVNDTMGHKAGDQLLYQVAQRLRNTLREDDMVARLGGDEFLVVSENLRRPEDSEVVAHKMAGLFQRPFLVDRREIFVSASVGIAVYPQDGQSAAQMLQSADTAMYHAKFAGKNSYRFFTAAMQQAAEDHLAIETELRRALERSEMQLVYQPKVDVASRRITGAEALLRWSSSRLGPVSPATFIPVAEAAGLMPQLGNWVLKAACHEAAGWRSLAGTPLHVAVNVSPQQFRNSDLLANVSQALTQSGLSAAMLELEITESVLVQDAPETMRTFRDLNDLGVRLSLDDFGTGYSSLSYLKRFPVQILKIDRAFVQDLGRNPSDASLVDAIIAMAQSLRMEIVAEGVETAAEFDYLAQRGVDLVQGYYFSRPVDADSFRKLLAQGLHIAAAADPTGGTAGRAAVPG